jgi:hypothetical protein
MNRSASFSALGTSIAVHIAVMIALYAIKQELDTGQPEVVLETVFDDEREQEEFTKELETETEIAETQNIMAGGAVSTAVGGSGAPAVSQVAVEESESLQEVDFNINVSNITLPGENIIGNALGVGEVNGNTGQVVEGYGAALGLLTRELIGLMRKEKVMVVWLFDESFSMKDDQEEIAQKFHKVYEELGIQQKTDKELRKTDQVLLTSILSFGAGVHELTKAPTSNVNEIRAAIDNIPVDESGDENMCAAIGKAVLQYGPKARSQKRRLVLIVVSDESPSDSGDQNLNDYGQIEEAIQVCEKARSPVYILGRESIFGYPYARIRWKDPVYNLNHWVRINRGPETAYPECLMWNGLHARSDSASSGFGPYSQVRISKETGGIFFMLPGEEENLINQGAIDAREFKALAMKEYEPLLLSRRVYEEQRARSKFRQTCWEIIRTLNPHSDKKLNMRYWHFSIEPAEFQKQGKAEFDKASYAMILLDKAVSMLDEVKPLRAKEESQRWRACYDLIYGQCIAYRVRLFQYLLALDDHASKTPPPSDPKHNRWHIRWVGKPPAEVTDAQFKRLKGAFKLKGTKEEYMAMLAEERQRASENFSSVMEEHDGTPWFARAKWDRSRGYAFEFYSYFHDPKYNEVGAGKRIQIPKF